MDDETEIGPEELLASIDLMMQTLQEFKNETLMMEPETLYGAAVSFLHFGALLSKSAMDLGTFCMLMGSFWEQSPECEWLSLDAPEENKNN